MIAVDFSGSGLSGLATGQGGEAWELIHRNATDLTPAVYGENGGVNLYLNGRTAFVQQQRIGAGFFHVLGVKPLLGREFKDSEDKPGGPNLTVLSYAAWHRFFHGDPSVIGRHVDLRGSSFTVIGVMPSGFHTDAPADVWTPLQPNPADKGNYQIIGRLHPGVTLAAASGQLTSIAKSALDRMYLGQGVSFRETAVPLEILQAKWSWRGVAHKKRISVMA